MKKQTIAIIATITFLLAIGVLILLHFRKGRAQDTSGIYAFLNEFNDKLRKKNVDSAMTYFDAGLRGNQDYRLLVMKLINFQHTDDSANLDPSVSLDLGSAQIKGLTPTTSEVSIPTTLRFEKLEARSTVLTLKLAKKGNSYSIIQVTSNRFLLDYITYSNFIKDKTLRDEDRFSPETLAAFKAADQLKAKYDSVIWFAHVNGQTYFYVVKGKWSWYDELGKRDSSKFLMGLVGPDMKEIIPAEYNLIHNVNGTFNNMVEVEKDGKRGFYDLTGKNTLPAIYDAIYPINNPEYLAALKKGSDYFWLKNDYSVSDKTEIKMAEILTSIKKLGPYVLTDAGLGDKNITEFNSRDQPGSIYIAPSYLVDLNLISPIKLFRNPLRKRVEYEDVSKTYTIETAIRADDANNNWFQATFYKIRDYYLGGRSGLYERKNVLVVDNRHNKVYTADVELGHEKELEDGLGEASVCDVNLIKAINDSLFEIKSASGLYASLYDSTKTIQGGVYYSYFTIKNNKLIALRTDRVFSFTKYVKMTDTYLNGCYTMTEGLDYKTQKKYVINSITQEMLSYMKNEIYADYKYRFTDKRWRNVFMDWGIDDNKTNVRIDDSLTVIDKYNLNFINQKLNTLKSDKAKTSLK